jgi:hypothetical protein
MLRKCKAQANWLVDVPGIGVKNSHYRETNGKGDIGDVCVLEDYPAPNTDAMHCGG